MSREGRPTAAASRVTIPCPSTSLTSTANKLLLYYARHICREAQEPDQFLRTISLDLGLKFAPQRALPDKV